MKNPKDYSLKKSSNFFNILHKREGSPVEMSFSIIKGASKLKIIKENCTFLKLISSILQEKLSKEHIKKIFRKIIKNDLEFLDG